MVVNTMVDIPEDLEDDEFDNWRDDGCPDVAARCVECPLPRCASEFHGGLAGAMRWSRDQEILALRGAGVPVRAIALRFQLSRPAVYNILSAPGRPGVRGPDRGPRRRRYRKNSVGMW